MALEIEMKARVADRAAVEASLARLGRRVRDFSKADAYYLFPGAEPGQGRTFRIRWDEGKSAAAIVTWSPVTPISWPKESEGRESALQREVGRKRPADSPGNSTPVAAPKPKSRT